MQEKSVALNEINIDLKAIADNYKIIKKFIGNKAECAANLKANAYGLGVLQVMRCLSEAGCNKFFVTDLAEAIELRNLISITDEIYVLNGIYQGEEQEFLKYHIIPVLNNMAQFNLLKNYCIRKNRNFSAVLNVDTCENQFGFSRLEIENLAKTRAFDERIKIHFVMSQPTYNANQITLITKLKQFLKSPVSYADSKAIEINDNCYFNIIRLGLVLYGFKKTALSLTNAISITSTIIQINELKEDITILDGIKILKNTILATLPIGYSNGLNRAAKAFYINGNPAPIVGNVSMDLTVIDVSNIPKEDLFLGAKVEIIGNNMDIADIAKKANTSVHDILMSFGARMRKNYTGTV